MPHEESTWNQYQRLVLSKLDEHQSEISQIRSHVVQIRIDVSALKIRAGVWGALAGLLPAIGVAIFWMLRQ